MKNKREYDRIVKLVNEFADEMKAKLLSKAADGWEGWRDRANRESFYFDLNQHTMRALLDDDPLQLIDVANYAAFLWHQAGRPKW